jgi:hypothetical protein
MAVITSVIIVNYNAGTALERMLESLLPDVAADAEIVVVDNASADGSVARLERFGAAVRVIANTGNVGFARAVNQGLAATSGRYALLLNPDVVVSPGAVPAMVRFMDARPDAGVAGGRVLEADGRLQLACRRGIPTPWVAFCRFSGLGRLFPNSRLFARYNMTFLDPDQPARVDAVSGSFMMIRREVLDRIGPLDEDYFMYAEDIDFCYRAGLAGWAVYYNPEAVITHTKGVCAESNRARAAYEFYNTMWTFHKKHFMKKTFPPLNLFIFVAIWFMKYFKSWTANRKH